MAGNFIKLARSEHALWQHQQYNLFVPEAMIIEQKYKAVKNDQHFGSLFRPSNKSSSLHQFPHGHVVDNVELRVNNQNVSIKAFMDKTFSG